uniref:Uncharacterized protein n=1 Tax=Anguilla anguilla TaxID=7936 RepID=A0A0E9TMH8_ANGAN
MKIPLKKINYIHFILLHTTEINKMYFFWLQHCFKSVITYSK